MKAGHTALNFTWTKEKCVIILATVAIYVYFESAENTPIMNIKLFFVYEKSFPQCFWKRIIAGWDDIQIWIKVHVQQLKILFFSR